MSDSEPTQVAERVWRIPLRTPTLPPATHTNAYLVGERDALFVEPASPYPEEIARALAWVQTRAEAGVRIGALLLTHHHADHVGGASAMATALGLPIWAHEETRGLLDGAVSVDRVIGDGEVLQVDGRPRLTALHTPGHAPGHLCFFDESTGSLLCGDMVASVGTILVDPRDGDMRQYLASLERMKGLGAARLLPAHGDPIDDVLGKLTSYQEHRRWREAAVIRALTPAPKALSAVARNAYADAPDAPVRLVEASTEAHLLKLESEGRAARDALSRWYRDEALGGA